MQGSSAREVSLIRTGAILKEERCNTFGAGGAGVVQRCATTGVNHVEIAIAVNVQLQKEHVSFVGTLKYVGCTAWICPARHVKQIIGPVRIAGVVGDLDPLT
jgi:hypothetical protein